MMMLSPNVRHQPLGYLVFPLVALMYLSLSACTEPGDTSEADSLDAEITAESMIESGRISYMTYCLNCHGDEGGGDGPLTDLITLTPTDLTALAQSHDGTFPTERIDGVIRGYDEELMIAHGDREMPIWEDVWKEQTGGADAEAVIDARIAELIAYLDAIQG